MVVVQKRTIRWAISLFLVMLYFSGLPTQAQYGGGTGEPNDLYLIYTAEQMNTIGADPNDWDKHFKLMADIDLSAYTGTSFNIIGGLSSPFRGVFDGNGKKITNLNHARGLFVSVSGAIKDLGLIDANIDAGTVSFVGSLVGDLGGTITNCYAEGGSVLGENFVGGLVGWNDGTITNCYSSTGSVSGEWRVGGLVGNNGGTITNCYSSALSVSGSISNIRRESIGGLVGGNGGTIDNCYATASVSGNYMVGGLVGENWLTITNCYSTGSVSGGSDVGGLVGDNGGTITNCYSSGDISGGWSVGGLVGWNYGTITNCYATGSVSGDWLIGGLVGNNSFGEVMDSFWDVQTSEQSTSAGGTGKTTFEMQVESIFTDAGWDFVGESVNGTEDIWTIYEGTNYPRLAWESGEPIPKPYGGGTGTQANPYLIYTAEQFNMIGLLQHWGRHYKLMADIDLSGFTGTDFNIIGYFLGGFGKAFTGVFDGNGKKIYNFSYTSTNRDYIGLFAWVDGENAEIKNLGLIDPNVDAGTGFGVGSLVAVNSGTISNCYVQGGTVSGGNNVGGLVGDNAWGGTITNCYSTASVTGTGWSVSVGGLVGDNWQTITNCYSTGSVSGSGWGGSGLVGRNYYATITNSFWDIENSGQASSDGGTGKTTAEMQTESTFTDAGWDFVDESVNGTEDIWSICEGTNYPRLAWQIPAGDFVCPDGITIEDFVFFAEYWRDDNCDISNDYCDGTDLDFSGTVDEADLEILIENWLADSN